MDKKYHDIQVTDRNSFVEFLELFWEDYTENKAEWKNDELPDFIDAMMRYAVDIQDFYDDTRRPINADVPTWTVFADIMKGAKVYE